jgi:acid phosphatase class B
METINYKNKNYKIYTGKKGGKYILKNNKKLYLKNKNMDGGFLLPEIAIGAAKTAGYLSYALFRLSNSFEKKHSKK